MFTQVVAPVACAFRVLFHSNLPSERRCTGASRTTKSTSLLLSAFLLTAPLNAAQAHEVQQSPQTVSDAVTVRAEPAKPIATLFAGGRRAPRLPKPVVAPTLAAVTSKLPLAVAIPTPAVPDALILKTAVSVKATKEPLAPKPISTHEMTGLQILQSAGTFADLPRYLQTLPGLIGGSDVTNASFVRGGNSFESLYTVDSIEVPNINHLALANSSGGLNSMLDTEFISEATLHTGDMSSGFESHLSSVTEIRTLDLPQQPVYSFDLGYSGAGIRINRPLGPNSTFMFSARESVTNLFIKDVGLNGSPEFTNSFSKYTSDISPRDHLLVESLSGRDQLSVRPDPRDPYETNAYNTDYSGWRNTTGLAWQRTYTEDSIGTWTLSNSQDVQNLSQRDQINLNALVFRQNNRDGVSNVKYQYLRAKTEGTTTEAGVDLHFNRIAYDIAQPAGIYSPYSASSVPQGAFSATPNFHTLDDAVYYESVTSIRSRIVLRAGARLEKWGYRSQTLTGATSLPLPVIAGGIIPSMPAPTNNGAFLPHVSVSVQASQSINVRASWAKYAELPPYASIASQPANANLGLIQSQHFIVGGTVRINRYFSADVEAYRKIYSGYPVSTLYPQVSLASILPTINEPFSLLAMTSSGKGRTQGIELSLKQNPWHHIVTEANVSYSRAQFTGLDGAYRSGGADLPIVANVMVGFNVKRFLITMRDTAASGRPYTPFLQTASTRQDRGIYDLDKLNAFRGPIYNRLDLAVNREVMVHGHVMRLHVGALNVFNRENFYEYLWAPRNSFQPTQRSKPQSSIGFQPDFGMGYTF
jgi:hypothetical protein